MDLIVVAKFAIATLGVAAALVVTYSRALFDLPQRHFDRILFGTAVASRLGLFLLAYVVFGFQAQSDALSYYNWSRLALTRPYPWRERDPAPSLWTALLIPRGAAAALSQFEQGNRCAHDCDRAHIDSNLAGCRTHCLFRGCGPPSDAALRHLAVCPFDLSHWSEQRCDRFDVCCCRDVAVFCPKAAVERLCSGFGPRLLKAPCRGCLAGTIAQSAAPPCLVQRFRCAAGTRLRHLDPHGN